LILRLGLDNSRNGYELQPLPSGSIDDTLVGSTGRSYIAGDRYSIADIACYPWIVPWKRQQQELDAFPNLRRWFDAVRARPATVRAYAKGEPMAGRPTVTEEGKKILFGQTAPIRPTGAAQNCGFTRRPVLQHRIDVTRFSVMRPTVNQRYRHASIP
jgi:hypothetical protein